MSADLKSEDAPSGVHWSWHLALAAAAATALAALWIDPSAATDERQIGQLTIARGALAFGAIALVGFWLLRRPLGADLAGAARRWREAPGELAAPSLVPPFASPLATRVFAGGLVAWFLAIALSYRAGLSWPNDITFENGPAETITVIAYLAATGFGLAAAQRLFQRGRRGTLRPWLLVFLAAGCFLIAAEETDWGQTYLNYASPESFEHANIQQDLSLHNLALPDAVPGTRWANWLLRGLGWLGGGVLPILLFASAPFRRWMWAWDVPLPPWWSMAALFAAACLPELHGDYGENSRQNVGSELREVTIGVAILIWVWSAWLRDRPTAQGA